MNLCLPLRIIRRVSKETREDAAFDPILELDDYTMYVSMDELFVCHHLENGMNEFALEVCFHSIVELLSTALKIYLFKIGS
jgi:hypothetical protein